MFGFITWCRSEVHLQPCNARAQPHPSAAICDKQRSHQKSTLSQHSEEIRRKRLADRETAMEAVGALGLASAVVQLTHFGWRVFSATTDRHRSTAGLADELVDIETASSDLNALVKQFHALGASQGIALSPADKSLAALAKTCAELSGDLLKAINTIKRADTGKRRTWHTIGQAFRAVLKEDEIRALQRRLEPLKSELMLHLIHFGRYVLFQM